MWDEFIEVHENLIAIPSDSLGPNQACTFFGATPGKTVISGAAYISQAYAYDVANTYKVNIPALLGFFSLFIIAQIVTLEVLHVRSHLTARLPSGVQSTIALYRWTRSHHIRP